MNLSPTDSGHGWLWIFGSSWAKRLPKRCDGCGQRGAKRGKRKIGLRFLLLGGDDGFQLLLSALLAVATVGSVGCGVGDLFCFLDGGLLDVGSIHFRRGVSYDALQLAGSDGCSVADGADKRVKKNRESRRSCCLR